MGPRKIHETDARPAIVFDAVRLYERNAVLSIAENAVVHGGLDPVAHDQRAAGLWLLVILLNAVGHDADVVTLLDLVAVDRCLIVDYHYSNVVYVEFVNGHECVGLVRENDRGTLVHHEHVVTNNGLTLALHIHARLPTRNEGVIATDEDVILLKHRDDAAL